MSNLLKQCYVVPQYDSKRVINSNGLAQTRIRELSVGAIAAAGGSKTSEDGFLGGIAAERVEIPPEPDPHEVAKQLIDDAKSQAEQLINDARSQAEQIVEDARIQAQEVFEAQRELGYTEGVKSREEELAEAERSLEEQRRKLNAEIDSRRKELESGYQMRMEELETDIVDALIPVFDKVFHIHFGDKREILLALVQNTLTNVEVGNKIKIRTGEADKEMLMEHMDEIRELAGDVSIELMQDMQMSDGQCQIETSYGVFDCGVDTHFQNLIRDIRSLV